MGSHLVSSDRITPIYKPWKGHLSNEKNPGWLGYIGDYTTQLYRDYNKPL